MKFAQRIFSLTALSYFILVTACLSLCQEARDKGFVYLHEIDPTIRTSLRYYSDQNFMAKSVDGYKKSVVIMTQQAAEALKKAQEEFIADGYCLVVYDAYRPQDGVNHFIKWSEDVGDQKRKSQYYPRINKADVFELGYVAKRSGHSRGSTIDLTLIKVEDQLHEIQEKERKLLDGFTITLLDDGTVDMGSSFDLVDEASHTQTNLVEEQFQKQRAYLKNVMAKHGFKNYSQEWWHFTLQDEPYSASQDSSYFNFPIE